MSANVKALLLDQLRESGLLQPPQLEELARLPEAKDPDPRPLAKQVLQRGWLTRFQLNLLAQGKTADLFVGPYILIDRLGEGGMGQVFKAQHRHMNRVVALKVIRKDKLKSEEAVQRFHREVQAAAHLAHPNIVLAYDAGQAGNTHYLSMELVDGHDLAHLVKERGPLPVVQACDYIRQAALGLQHAHERGMVHRDIKPHNLLVTRDGVVKILDMGLARLQQGLADGERHLTRTGAVIGTPDFLAPEQALNSRAADIRSDLYSLGCSLYFLLAGRAPFHAESLTELLLKHQMEQAVPLEQSRPDVPPGVVAIVDALLAKRSEDRIQTPAALAAALLPYCSGAPQTVPHLPVAHLAGPAEANSWATLAGDGAAAAKPPARAATATLADGSARGKHGAWRGSPLLLLGLLGGGAFVLLLGVLLAGVLAYALLARTMPPAPPVAAGPRPAPPPPVARPAPAQPVNPPPQGGQPAVIVPGNPAPQPEPQGPVPLVKGERRQLDANCFPVSGFTFSPDSRRALAVHNQMATVWDVETGQQLARLPPHPAAFLAGRFAPDGRKAYLTCFDMNVYAWDIATNSLSPLFRGSDYGQTTDGNCLAISPDGTRLYQGSGDNQRDANARPIKQGDDFLYHDTLVRIIDVATGKEAGRYTGHTSTVHTIDVSADGRRALSASEDSICLWDAQTGNLIRRLAENVVGKGNSWLEAHLAADGRTALLKLRDANLHVWDVDNDRELRAFGTPDARLQALALSPDGTRALTSTYVPDAVNQPGPGGIVIHLWDVASGKELRRFQGHTHFVVNPLGISPDDRLGISGSWDKTVRLWDLSADAPAGPGAAANPPEKGPDAPAPEAAAGGRTQRLLGHEGAVTALAGSQDGRRLLSGDAKGSVRLWDVDKGTQLIQLDGARGEIRSVALAPDGRFAAAAGAEGMWCWDTTTGQLVPAVKEEKPMGGVFFSADGQRLVVAGADGTIQSFVMDGKRFDWGMTAIDHGMIRCLAAVPGTELCVYVPRDDKIHVYDLTTRIDTRTLERTFAPVTAVACAPDGRQVAGVVGTAVQFWDPKTGVTDVAEGRFLRHSVRGTGVAYSPDGRHVLTGCEDKIARLWDAKTGQKQAELSGHKGPVTSVAFSGDGRFAFTGGADKAVIIWPVPKPAAPR